MSGVLNQPLRYLTGQTACDVSRLTGLPIYCRPRLNGPNDPVDPVAAEQAMARGLWREGDVVMDLSRLSWGEKWRVAWSMIGAYTYLRDCSLTA